MRTYEFPSFDGKKLHTVEYAPAGEPVGMVQIVHGMAEHIGRYDALSSHLADRGFLVFGADLRGHGKTDPESLGTGEDLFQNSLKDQAALSKHYTEAYPDLKLALYAHSYGSAIAQAYLSSSYRRFISGAVLSGSAYFKGAGFYAALAAAKAKCLFGGRDKPAGRMEKLGKRRLEKRAGGNIVSSLFEEAERHAADPLCDFPCSAGFYECFFRAATRLYGKDRAAALDPDLPLFLLSGACDPVGKMGKSVQKLAEFYRKNGVKSVRCVLMPDARHEFLNDVGKEDALRLITEFLFSCTAKPELSHSFFA